MKNIIIILLLIILLPDILHAKNLSMNAKRDSINKDDSFSKREDNFEFSLGTSGEIYFFNVVSTMKDEGQDLDFSDIKYRMEYEFEPVYMVSFQGYLRWYFVKIDADYKSDRFLKKGGEIEHDDRVASKLTKNNTVSDALELGINIFDLNTSFRSVQFDFGQAYVYDAQTGEEVSSGQIELKITDINIQYDFYPFGRKGQFIGKFSPGYKFMQYSLPRIVYRFEDTVEGETDLWEYAGETVPQDIVTKSHLGGFTWDMIVKTRDERYNFFITMGMFIGPNWTEFELNGDTKSPLMMTFVGTLKGGVVAEITNPGIRCRLRLMYDLSLISTESPETNNLNDDSDESRTKYVFGADDLFHGGTIAFEALF